MKQKEYRVIITDGIETVSASLAVHKRGVLIVFLADTTETAFFNAESGNAVGETFESWYIAPEDMPTMAAFVTEAESMNKS